MFSLVGARFGVVIETEVPKLQFEFARVKVLISGIFPVEALVTLVEGGRRFVVYVREEFLLDLSLRQVTPVI